MSLLDVTGVSVRFGGHQALLDVSFGAEAGAVTGLIGPNGAGKTTLFNVITGLQPPNSGPSRSTGGTSPGWLPTSGLGVVWLARSNASSCSRSSRSGRTSGWRPTSIVAIRVIEASTPIRWPRSSWSGSGCRDLADAKHGPAPDRARPGWSRSGAPSQHDPSVLLLDEPASGQTSDETQTFARLLADLAA